MLTEGHDSRWRTTILWTVLVAAAAAIYFIGISHELIWYDESVSVAIANHGFRDILRLLPDENHPPLYFLLLRLSKLVFGNSEWALRLPSAAAAVGLVGLGAGPVRRILGDRGAVAYAVVVLFTPVILIQAHEARMYSLGNLAVTGTVLCGFLAARDGRLGDWTAFVLWSLAASYLHYYGLIAAVIAHVYVLGRVLLRNRRQLRSSLLAAAPTAAGYLPWIAILLGQTRRVNASGFWIPPVSARAILSALLRPFVYRELHPEPLPIVRPWMAVAALLALALIIAGLILARRKKATSEAAFGTMALVTYLGTMAAAIAISLVSVPVFYSRYMVVCTGLIALLVGLGVSQLQRRWVQAGAIVLVAAFNTLTLKDIYTQHFNLPFSQVRQALAAEIKPGDLVITSDCFTVGPVFHYFPQAVIYYSSNLFESKRDEILKVMSPPLRYNEGLKDLLATRSTFWALTDNTPLCRATPDILGDEMGWEVVGQPRTFSDPPLYSFATFTLTRYAHTGGQANRGKITFQVAGIRAPGTLVADVFSGWPPTAGNHVRRQFLSVPTGRAAMTIGNLPYGDYVLGVFVDQNNNSVPDAGEGIWAANGQKIDPKVGLLGASFDELKFSFHEPEHVFSVPLWYSR
ncbi:MAG TPA: glycosyltransferase family 39 protein [Spirochaetia bacterium]|nr:glycosyltransferase family 39 protein [Spirochaetia bacterium]